MKKPFFAALLLTHSLLQADGFTTLFMSASLFILLFTLIIALMFYLKNLQRELLRYGTFFRQCDTPALFVDTKGAIRDINESALTLLGYTKEQLAGQKWHQALLRDQMPLPIPRTAARGEEASFVVPLVRADGTLLEANVTRKSAPGPLKGALLTLTALR